MTNALVAFPNSNDVKQVISTVRLMTNEANLYQNYRYIFADSTKVIGELMQNARRAGATKIMFTMAPDSTELVIEDNGSGINDFQNLFTNSTSGWDEATQAKELSFGQGFLSVLYASDEILIESRGQQCLVNAEKIIAMEPMDVTSSDYIGQTRITLRNFKLNSVQTSEAISQYASGFAVPVILNNVEVARLNALDVLSFVQGISIGHAELVDKDLERTQFYFQGLPIQNPMRVTKGISYGHNVVHLDSSFEVKMPDRHTLYDAQKQVGRIKASMTEGFIEKLKSLKASLSAEEFIQHYGLLDAFNQLELLNDVPLLPVDVVKTFDEYPTMVDHVIYSRNIDKPLSKEAVENGTIKLFTNLDTCYGEHGGHSMIIQTLIYENDWMFIEHKLHPDHWVYQSNAIDLDEAEIEVNAESNIQSTFCGERIYAHVHILDQLQIKINGQEFVLDDPAVAAHIDGYGDDPILYLGPTSNVEVALTQGSSYQGEYDYQESDLDTDKVDLTNLRNQLLGEAPEESIKQAVLANNLNSAPNCNRSTTVVAIQDSNVISEPLQKVLQNFIVHLNLQVESSAIDTYINDVVLGHTATGS